MTQLVYTQNPPKDDNKCKPEKMHNPRPMNHTMNPTQISQAAVRFIFKARPKSSRKIAMNGMPMASINPKVIQVAEDGFIKACCNGMKS